MTRACDACGVDYEAKRPQARFCSDLCRKRASRNPRLTKATPATAAPVAATTAHSVTSRTEQRIVDLGLELDPGAAVALVLARRLDSDAETGAAVATLAKQYAAYMEDLGKRGKRAADPLDELQQRLLRKVGGA